jgi:hypothetical protein
VLVTVAPAPPGTESWVVSSSPDFVERALAALVLWPEAFTKAPSASAETANTRKCEDLLETKGMQNRLGLMEHSILFFKTFVNIIVLITFAHNRGLMPS